MRRAYVRFVTDQIDSDSGRRLGVFQAAADLVDARVLLDYELAEMQALRRWFDEHLKKPDRFTRSQKSGAAHRAISWFKCEATEHVSRMHSICRILNEHGIRTIMIISARPGYIVFEDAHQVAAEPFAETMT